LGFGFNYACLLTPVTIEDIYKLFQKPQEERDRRMETKSQVEQHPEPEKDTKKEIILCPHCLRTATNGIKCQGICVADSGY